MRKLRTSWRYPLFWLLICAALIALALQFRFTHDLITKYRDLYSVLLRGDLTQFQNTTFLQETGILLVYTSLAFTLVVFLGFRFLRGISMWMSNRYYITPEKVISHQGLIARDYREAWRVDLRNIHIKQTILDRLLVVGDMILSTPGHTGLVIELKKISSPFKLKQKLTIAIPMTMMPAAEPPKALPEKAGRRPAVPAQPAKTPPSTLRRPASLMDAKLLTNTDEDADEEPSTQITNLKES